MERDRAGRLVGRGHELATFDRLLAGLGEGVGGELVFLSGEPGIGKSSLLAEIGRRAAHAGIGVLRGGCLEDETPSYWPWRQVLRGLRDLGDLGGRLELGPAGRLLAGDQAPTSSGETDFDLYDAVARVLVAHARQSPLVVLLDDLQWADESSLRLLGFLRGVTVGESLLVVGAYRDAEVTAALEALTPAATSVPLPGLDHEAVVALMTEVAGPRPPDDLAAQVAVRCRGNPFFVRETARMAFTSNGGWVDDAESGQIPAGVRVLLRRRLGQLSARCREMLALVAVAGDGLDVAVLVSAADVEGDPEALAEAERARIITRAGGRVSFVHDLFREVVLADQDPATMAEMNGRVAMALAAALDGGARRTPEARARLAKHFAAAGDAFAGVALQHSVEAARAALGPEEAYRHYERALGLAEKVDGAVAGGLPDRLELELAVATARAQIGGHPGARDDLAAVAAGARLEGRADVLAEAALATHALGARTRTQVLGCLAILEDALAVVRPDDLARASRLQAARSRVLSRISGRDAEAWSSARQAAALARRAGDPASEFEALLAQHDLLWTKDGHVTAEGIDRRLSLCGELISVTGVDPRSERPVLAHQLRAAALIELGDPQGLTELARHCELAEALGTVRGRWLSTSRRAVLAAVDGRVEDALGLATQARQQGTMIGEPDAIGCDQTLRCSLALLGINPWNQPIDPPVDDPLWKVRHVLTGAHALASGDYNSARAAVAHGLPPEDAFYSIDLLAIAAWVWASCGDNPERERLLSMLEPWAGRHFVVGGCAAYYGPVDRLRGDLAAALERRRQAAEMFDAAREAVRRLGARVWAPPDSALGSEQVVFDREGATWRLSYAGRVAHLPDAKGLHDLATLVANPATDVHVLTLLGRPVPTTGADPILDQKARTAYRARLSAIDRALDEADHTGASEVGDALEHERAALIAQLASATGLGGRPRRLGDQTESARKTVGARIRESLRRIEEVHPALGAHLRASVTIGTSCRYDPTPVTPVHAP